MENGFASTIKLDSFVNDLLPLPPTPNNKAWPCGYLRIREILEICSQASKNNTKFIFCLPLASKLYFSWISSNAYLKFSRSKTSQYSLSISPLWKSEKINLWELKTFSLDEFKLGRKLLIWSKKNCLSSRLISRSWKTLEDSCTQSFTKSF